MNDDGPIDAARFPAAWKLRQLADSKQKTLVDEEMQYIKRKCFDAAMAGKYQIIHRMINDVMDAVCTKLKDLGYFTSAVDNSWRQLEVRWNMPPASQLKLQRQNGVYIQNDTPIVFTNSPSIRPTDT